MDDIYLDNHSATKPYSSVLKQMMSFHEESWASLSSPHQLGQQQYLPTLTALSKIYSTMGATAQDGFYLSASGSEAISQVFMSVYLDVVRESGKTHFLSTSMESAPFLWSLKRLEKLGCIGKTLSVNAQGQLTKQALEEAIRPKTCMLSLSWANPLTGVIHPLYEIAEVCKEKGIYLHVDASAMIGKYYFQFQDIKIDYLTFDGALFHAPRGCAGTLVRFPASFSSLIVGQSSENTASLVALSESLEQTMLSFDHLCTETARLRDQFESKVVKAIPGAVVWMKDAERLPNTSCISFPGVVNELLLYLLNSKGVYASMGGGHFQKLSHLLTHCGADPVLAQCALSFSLSYETKEEDVVRAVDIIVQCYERLRTYSIEVV